MTTIDGSKVKERKKEKRNEFLLKVKCYELSNTFKSHFMLIKTVCLGSQTSAR